jgi:hypothetical protein
LLGTSSWSRLRSGIAGRWWLSSCCVRSMCAVWQR